MNRILKQVSNTKGIRFYSSSSQLDAEYMFPSVRRLLVEYGINSSKEVTATGPQNRLLKGDVLAYIKSKNLSPVDRLSLISASVKSASSSSSSSTEKASAPTIDSATTAADVKSLTDKVKIVTTITNEKTKTKIVYEDIENNNIRKVIATKLSQSKQQVPHLYMTVECELDNVLAMRKSMPEDVKISVNDFVLRACALALRDNPKANAKWSDQHGEAILNPTVDISFAVSTDRGLITPIITNTDKKQLLAISNESKQLALKARDGKLKPEEFIGGTFSVSNLGMFGITSFNAIINYPQAGILAIGTGRKVLRPPSTYQPIKINNIDNNNNNNNNNNYKPNNNSIGINTNGPMTIEQLEKLLDSTPSTQQQQQQQQPTITNNVTINQFEYEQPKVVNVMDVTLSGDNRVFDDEIAGEFLSSFKYYLSNPKNMIL
ncbi:hypothetical protein ACTA71_007024 [Dictyostelium dimigraforme]